MQSYKSEFNVRGYLDIIKALNKQLRDSMVKMWKQPTWQYEKTG